MKYNLVNGKQRQRYAIRKFSVGTGSTLIGVLLFLGVQHHADAAEIENEKVQQKQSAQTDSESTLAQSNTVDDKAVNETEHVIDAVIAKDTNETEDTTEVEQDTGDINNQGTQAKADAIDNQVQTANNNIAQQNTTPNTEKAQESKQSADEIQNDAIIQQHTSAQTAQIKDEASNQEATLKQMTQVSSQTKQQQTTNIDHSKKQTTNSTAQSNLVHRNFVKPVIRAYVANNGVVNVNDDTFTFEDLKNSFNDANVTQINFNTDRQFDFTEGLKLNRGLIINVAEGRKVDFNVVAGQEQRLVGIDASLKNGEVLSINNQGQLNFNNFNKGIAVHGGDTTTKFNINGGEMNFNQFNQSGIDVGNKYTGEISIQDTAINTNSTRDSKGSTLRLGDSFDAKVNINNSNLHLVNNGDSPTSNAIETNASYVNFTNSEIYSSSRAHYNFNTFNPDHRRGDQQVIFSNTNLNVNTPTDSNPHRSYWIFNIPADAVAINSEFTHFNVTDNSTISQNINDFNGDEKGIELERSTLTVENATLDLRSVGFDKGSSLNQSLAWPSLIEVKDDAKVTIDRFHSLPNNSNVATDFPKMIISGGSVSLPLEGNDQVPDGTQIVNEHGEVLTHFAIDKSNLDKNVDDNYDLTISDDVNDPTTHPSYNYGLDENKLHDQIAHVWSPAVTVDFFKDKNDAINNENSFNEAHAVTPRGNTIDLVGRTAPTIVDGNPVKWFYADTDLPYNDSDKILKDTKLYPIVQMLPLNEAPTITTTPKVINQGDHNFDVISVVTGATDKEDGDLSNQVEVIDNGGFNADVPGQYTITVKVTDSAGASYTTTEIVTVVPVDSDADADSGCGRG
ncbi:YSIRK-type signal peptide-containing protein [Staphylococcus caeli]|uniref:LPXTG cell wall-anchored protein n=1 Tax=Staphylococcus caeli TaxID=2201815 RepID=A0A1D4NQB2_9STAP|nr:YSIRK-type signal peptide-containing protein [Staphylococcus caeli]AWM30246.1 Surface protein G [Staphylococcus caeli]SCT10114.1 putative LPXTG cell wall-anchored protein [Staphylococcus caeli]SCT12864.1 putative LPXTG cell wall-anchored protein [Staphylococcus caeli]